MKLGGRVSNMCLSSFMVETSRYDYPRTNQGPLRRNFTRWIQTLAGQCAPTKGNRRAVGWLMGNQCHTSNKTYPNHLGTFYSQSLNLLRMCGTERGGWPSIDPRSVDSGVVCECQNKTLFLLSSFSIQCKTQLKTQLWEVLMVFSINLIQLTRYEISFTFETFFLKGFHQIDFKS